MIPITIVLADEATAVDLMRCLDAELKFTRRHDPLNTTKIRMLARVVEQLRREFT